MKMRLVLLLLCLGSAAAQAALKWEQTEIELHPAAGAPTAVGTFKYKNVGSAPVHFNSIRTSCGCTTAAQKKDVVGPGESGEITATFKVGSSVGPQQKSVRVETDDPEAPVTTLVLRAMIPQLLELRPTFVYWQNGETPAAKVIAAKAARELNAKALKVTSSSPDFSATVESAGRGEFRIKVVPRDTKTPATASLKVEPDAGGKAFFATVRVMNPGTSAN